MRVGEVKGWQGNMEADYLYTAGVAGERFFRELRVNGRIVGTFCPRCNVLYLPPRIYCEVCFTHLDQWEEVPNKGRITSYTVARVGRDGKPLAKPQVWVFVRFPGVRGGLIHRTNLPPEALTLGMEVEAVIADHREGSLDDIRYFKAI